MRNLLVAISIFFVTTSQAQIMLPAYQAIQYRKNTLTPVYCTSGSTAIVNVTNPTTGKIWMDRNLGATQRATSSTDVNSYGDLYQWGRRTDGHQCRNSSTTNILSSIDQPNNSNFILPSADTYDWRTPQNDNLWQGVNGVNNPCPSGYRLPSDAELFAELMSWSSKNSVGAFSSKLKLPLTGIRITDGSIIQVGTYGYLWSSTVMGNFSGMLSYGSLFDALNPDNYSTSLGNGRGIGIPVRCIKN
jgi:hypothetical protein